MTLVIAAALIVVAGALAIARFLRHPAPPADTPSAKRILFPFRGDHLSAAALNAAIRLARAENATLVPAYLAQVPMSLPLSCALPKQSKVALPLIETIEQRAAKSGVSVDPRIERGRTSRHALSELLDHERFDRIIAPAATNKEDGFSAEDIAWLLDHGEGEIVVFRPSESEDSLVAP